MKKTRKPDMAQMRRELDKLGVKFACLRPDWLASRATDGFIMVRNSLRDVVHDSYKTLIQEKQ